ncbi:hypothetical protein MRX96_022141 [Rhipicephalus microplus]
MPGARAASASRLRCTTPTWPRYRAKNHVISKVDVSSSSSDSSGGSADSITTSQYVQAVKVLDNLQTAMYFV